MMVFAGAVLGIDVSEPLRLLLRSVVDDEKADDPATLTLVGSALDHLCRRSTTPPEGLLALATTPRVAARLVGDHTLAFWATLLRHLGVPAVEKLADELALPDLGLGLFDALERVTPSALERWQERPDMLRSVLVRSAEGRFSPSPVFYERAWSSPRRAEEIGGLDQIPAGAWLESFIEKSVRWPMVDRLALLRWLAKRSREAEVRRRCVDILITSESPPPLA